MAYSSDIYYFLRTWNFCWKDTPCPTYIYYLYEFEYSVGKILYPTDKDHISSELQQIKKI